MCPNGKPRSRLQVLGGSRNVTAKSSAAAKVQLFRRLFHGRNDVFPKLRHDG